MGIYLNPGDDKFFMDRQSEIYVDKSGLIAYLKFPLAQQLISVGKGTLIIAAAAGKPER